MHRAGSMARETRTECEVVHIANENSLADLPPIFGTGSTTGWNVEFLPRGRSREDP